MWPKKKQTSKLDVFYIKVRVRRVLLCLCENPGYESFKENVNDSDLLDGLRDKVDLEEDQAHDPPKETWIDVLKDNDMEKSNSIVIFLNCLKLLSQSTKGFICKLVHDEKGIANGLI